MGFVRLFLGLVVREHAIKLWPYLCRRSPIQQTPYSVLDRPRFGLHNPQPCDCKPAFSHGSETSERRSYAKHIRSSSNSASLRQPTNRANSTFGMILKDLLVFPADHLPNDPVRTCAGTAAAVEAANSTQRAYQSATKLSSDVGRPL